MKYIKTVPDTCTITIEKNVRFKVEICSKNFNSIKIQNGHLLPLLSRICLIFEKQCPDS